MPLPVMPKGVEHICAQIWRSVLDASVPLPVMPKGVEHDVEWTPGSARLACPSQ